MLSVELNLGREEGDGGTVEQTENDNGPRIIDVKQGDKLLSNPLPQPRSEELKQISHLRSYRLTVSGRRKRGSTCFEHDAR